MTISMCRLRVGKTIKNVINILKGSVYWSSVMNLGHTCMGYRRGAKCAKHHIHSALNPSFVVESRVGSR